MSEGTGYLEKNNKYYVTCCNSINYFYNVPRLFIMVACALNLYFLHYYCNFCFIILIITVISVVLF